MQMNQMTTLLLSNASHEGEYLHTFEYMRSYHHFITVRTPLHQIIK